MVICPVALNFTNEVQPFSKDFDLSELFLLVCFVFLFFWQEHQDSKEHIVGMFIHWAKSKLLKILCDPALGNLLEACVVC